MSTNAIKAKKAAFYSALKALDAGPREIETAREQYKADQQYISEMESKGFWSPFAIQRMKDAAQTKRDDAIRKAVDRMRPALEVVQTEQNNPSEMLDIDNAKLQNAITVVNTMGKKLSPSDQLAIVEKFRGDQASLNFIADLFTKNGLYYADYARQLTTPVPNQAIENLAVEIGRYDYNGDFNMSNIFWTRNEFGKALERYGVNPASNPYENALRQLKRNGETDFVRNAAAQALANAAADGESGNEDTMKQALDTCLAQLEAES